MLDASHVLMTSVRRPRGQGLYELSMRLVDTRTGVILWEEQGDRLVSGLRGNIFPSAGKVSRSKDLSGIWRDPVLLNQFEVTDDGENVSIKLIRSDHISEFELRGHFVDDIVRVDSCFIRFKAGNRRHSIDATIKQITEKKYEIRHDTIAVNGYGAVYRGPRQTFIMERSE
jgi:hypothetical protein